MNLSKLSGNLYFPDLENSIASIIDQLYSSDAMHKLLIVIDSLTFSVAKKIPSFLEYFEKNGFLVSSVFPTITSTALTSIYHGRLPGEHGIVAHKFFVPEFNIFLETLSMKRYDPDRNDFYPLEYAGIDPAIIAWTKTKFSGVTIGFYEYISQGLSRVLYGDSEVYGFHNTIEAVSITLRYLEKENAFVSLYFDDIDTLSHIFSPSSKEVKKGIESLWSNILWLLEKIPPESEVIILADHGQVTLEREKVVPSDDQKLAEVKNKYDITLVINGDIALGFLPEKMDIDNAVEDLQNTLGDDFLVLSTDRYGSKLYGKWNDRLKSRCGNIVILSRPGAAIVPHDSIESELFRGNHGSLSKDELTVPVIRIRT